MASRGFHALTDRRQIEALDVYEILNMILNFADNPTCAVAAAVCRVWKELALDLLWRSLPSMLPVLRLLGPLAYSEKNGWNLRDRFPAGDWATVASYTRRIHVLRHDERKGYIISDRLAMHFLCMAPSRSMSHPFPALQRVNWEVTGETASVLMVATSPVLQHLTVTFWNGKTTLPIFLQALANQPRRNLLTLQLEWNSGLGNRDEGDSPHNLLLKLLEKEQDVRVLGLRGGSVGREHIEMLQILKNLTQLSLTDGLPGEDQVSAALVHVPASCSQVTVFNLSLRWFHSSFAFLAPVLQMQQLRQLRIHARSTIPIQHEEIVEMGRAWIHLDTLTFSAHFAQPGTPISHLLTFAKAFSPTLRTLGMSLNCDELPAESPQITNTFPNLKLLAVGTLAFPKGGEARIANLLAKLCPKAEVVPTEDLRSFHEMSQWRRVAELVKSLQEELGSGQLVSAE